MEKMNPLVKSVENLAEPICVELGIELVEVTVRDCRGDVNIQVFADRPTGGIGMDECVTLNRRLALELDNVLDLGDNYTLEVSTPGLDRYFSWYRNLHRALGRDVRLLLKEPVSGKREISGNLIAVSEIDVILKTRQGEVVVPMEKIEKARQIIN